jgi:hypothetical protein
MKKYLIPVCIPFFLISCKKSNPAPTTTLDVVGKWSLYSWDQSGSGGLNIDATQFPCLLNNVIQINADYSTIRTYTGTDTCYVTPRHGLFNGGTSIGMVGQAPVLNTWSRSGNNIYIGDQPFIISSSNGKLYLTSSITVTQGFTSPVTFTTVDIKE